MENSEIFLEEERKSKHYEAKKRLRYVYLPIIYRSFYRLFLSLYHPKPKWAYLELTNKCNLRCKMCSYQATHGKTGYMSKQHFESYVNQLSEIGLDVLYLHFGGESLLHPQFEDFLKYAIQKRDKGKIGKVGWVDNGMLFNQAIADLVVSLKVDFIIFSLDGLGQVNDGIRIGSDYSVIEKNIKYLLNNRGAAKKPEVSLNVVDYGKTEEQKSAFYREWTPFVDEIVLLPFMLPDNTWADKNTLSENLKTIPPPAFCHFPMEFIGISWDGKVNGCCQDYIFKMNLGDATKENIQRIWVGKKFQDLRKAALNHSFPKDLPCYKCEWWQVNFEPREEEILDKKAIMNYGYITRKVRKASDV
jgi:hypothetical protein